MEYHSDVIMTDDFGHISSSWFEVRTQCSSGLEAGSLDADIASSSDKSQMAQRAQARLGGAHVQARGLCCPQDGLPLDGGGGRHRHPTTFPIHTGGLDLDQYDRLLTRKVERKINRIRTVLLQRGVLVSGWTDFPARLSKTAPG